MVRNTSYRFGPYRLVPKERALLRDGRRIRLAPKAFDTLLLLLNNRGHLIGKDQLMAQLWPETCVEEGNLTQNIFILRRVLGEGTDEGQKYIETVARCGYRFVAEVEELSTDHTEIKQSNSERPSNLLAVLPFVNSDDDPKMDYLADGITGSTINSLSNLPQLRVMARSAVFRYKGQDRDPREIGRKLDVSYVLMGRVSLFENRLMIEAELIDVADGWQLWGANYSRDSKEIFDVQEEIAREISAALQLKLSKDDSNRLAKRPTVSPDAYHNYLRGRYYWDKYTKSALEKAIDYFGRASDADPAYALAYVGIADSYFRLSTSFVAPREALVMAKAAILKALEIDEYLPEARASLGMIKMRYDWDWEGAEKELLCAIDLNRNYPRAHQWYATYLESRGRFDEALTEMRTALNLDPLSLQIGVSLAVTFWKMRAYDCALEQLLKVVDFEPQFQPARLALGVVYEQLGAFKQSVIHFRRALELGETSMMQGFLGRVYALMGNEREAHRIIKRLEKEANERFVSAYSVGLVHSAMNEIDKAFDWFELAFQQKDEFLSLLKVDPRLDSLRTDDRYHDLLRRVGLD
ncbi:MAG TPA: winged helix-turn-helix domain-containing protein [Pyrinomonadaceae bacterium]|nr:winged helix-turn-helix domain-containing protein [Pyrinomonadaceae bacterium]